MTKATATEVKNRFGEFMEKARQEPVVVEKTGRKQIVMVNYEEYERLVALEDHYWGMLAAEAEKSGLVGSGTVMELLVARMKEAE